MYSRSTTHGTTMYDDAIYDKNIIIRGVHCIYIHAAKDRLTEERG